MLLLKCVTAYMAALQLMETELDYSTASALITLKRRLGPHVEFFSAKERELAQQYGKKDENGNVVFDNGHFEFESKEAGEEFNKKKLELSTVEIQEDWQPLKAKVEKIKPAVLEALQGFIDFGGD